MMQTISYFRKHLKTICDGRQMALICGFLKLRSLTTNLNEFLVGWEEFCFKLPGTVLLFLPFTLELTAKDQLLLLWKRSRETCSVGTLTPVGLAVVAIR